MELSFTVYPSLFHASPVTCVTKQHIQQHIVPVPHRQQQFQYIINSLGQQSATSQSLPTIITTYDKLMNNTDNQILFISIDSLQPNTVNGYIKLGYKNLYYYHSNGVIHQLSTQLCVLDFYVVETVQRHGVGKQLFDTTLQYYNTQPYKLAYDRPSHKLIAFLLKHYKLDKYIPQRNNYVVYNQYFDSIQTNMSTPLQRRINTLQSQQSPDTLDQFVHTHQTNTQNQYDRKSSISQPNNYNISSIIFNDITNHHASNMHSNKHNTSDTVQLQSNHKTNINVRSNNPAVHYNQIMNQYVTQNSINTGSEPRNKQLTSNSRHIYPYTTTINRIW